MKLIITLEMTLKCYLQCHPSLDRLDFVRGCKSRLQLFSDKNSWNNLEGRSRSLATSQL